MTKQDREKVATELRTSFKERADHTLHIPVTLPAKVTKIENDCIYLDLFKISSENSRQFNYHFNYRDESVSS